MALLVSRSAGAIRGENFGRVSEGLFFAAKPLI
jgi:hypothetical protein